MHVGYFHREPAPKFDIPALSLNDSEKALLKALEAQERARKRWQDKVEALRSEFAKDCTHKLWEPYRWEHDDGYGRQKDMIGHQCLLCLKRNSWPNMSTLWS